MVNRQEKTHRHLLCPTISPSLVPSFREMYRAEVRNRNSKRKKSLREEAFRKITQGKMLLIWHKGLAVDPAGLSTLCAFPEPVWPK